mgnify:CR=1 FL=1
MRKLRDDTHLLCVTKTVSPAMFGTLCFWFLVQTLCWGHCVGGMLWGTNIWPFAAEAPS